MAFKRNTEPARVPTGDELTAALTSIGFEFASHPSTPANIEDTLIAAAREGMDGDLRVLAMLVTWLEVHSSYVLADRLTKLAKGEQSPLLRCFWSAVGQWLSRDRRFAAMSRLYRGPRLDLLRSGTEFQVSRKGEDRRFRETALRVPAGTLRDRKQDVLTPAELVRRHPAYRFRVEIGPTIRADIWAALETEPTLRPTELARTTYASFASAWRTARDYRLLHRAT